MQKIYNFLFGLIFLTIIMSFDPNKSVEFVKGSLNSVLFQAKKEDKLVFVDFYADWCGPCKMMSQTTFQDAKLANYMSDNFVAYQVNIEATDGISHKIKYNIKVLPTLLVLDSDGNVKYRIEEGMSGSKLYEKLSQITNKSSATKDNTPQIAAQPKSIPNETNELNKNGLFEFDVNSHPNHGFGIQIGTFADYGNVLKQANKLKRKFGSQKVLVNIQNLNGKEVYRVIIGTFDNRKDADDYKVFMNDKGASGYVVDLSRL